METNISKKRVFAERVKSILYSHLIFLVNLSLVILLGYIVSKTEGVGFEIKLAVSVVSTSLIVFCFSYWVIMAVYNPRKPNDKEKKLEDCYKMVLAKANHRFAPKVYVLDSEDVNAFAFGPGFFFLSPLPGIGNGIVVSTAGINLWDYDELEAVLAHELSHIRQWDVGISSVMSIISGAVNLLWNKIKLPGFSLPTILLFGLAWITTKFLFPIGVGSYSQERERLADLGSAVILGSPLPLIRALQKIQNSKTETTLFAELSANHPSNDERIKYLIAIGNFQAVDS